jgi:hypothetical protein
MLPILHYNYVISYYHGLWFSQQHCCLLSQSTDNVVFHLPLLDPSIITLALITLATRHSSIWYNYIQRHLIHSYIRATRYSTSIYLVYYLFIISATAGKSHYTKMAYNYIPCQHMHHYNLTNISTYIILLILSTYPRVPPGLDGPIEQVSTDRLNQVSTDRLNEMKSNFYCHPKALNNHPLKEFREKVALYVHSTSWN